MRNDDPMYVKHLESALEAAELEIKGLEHEGRERDKILVEIQEQFAPTRMGELPTKIKIDKDQNLFNNFMASKVKNEILHKTIEQQQMALENCRLLAARHRKEPWALLILGFCAEGGVVGSTTR